MVHKKRCKAVATVCISPRDERCLAVVELHTIYLTISCTELTKKRYECVSMALSYGGVLRHSLSSLVLSTV